MAGKKPTLEEVLDARAQEIMAKIIQQAYKDYPYLAGTPEFSAGIKATLYYLATVSPESKGKSTS